MANSDSTSQQVSLHVQHRGAFANYSMARPWVTLDNATLYGDSPLDEVVFTGCDFALVSLTSSGQSESSEPTSESRQAEYPEVLSFGELVNERIVLATNYDSILVPASHELLREKEAKSSSLSLVGYVNLGRLITTLEPGSALRSIPYSGKSYLLGRFTELPFIQWVYWLPDDEGITFVILGSASNRGEEDKVYDIIGDTLQVFWDPSNPVEIVFINLLDYTPEERKQFPYSTWRVVYDRSTSADRSWALAA